MWGCRRVFQAFKRRRSGTPRRGRPEQPAVQYIPLLDDGEHAIRLALRRLHRDRFLGARIEHGTRGIDGGDTRLLEGLHEQPQGRLLPFEQRPGIGRRCPGRQAELEAVDDGQQFPGEAFDPELAGISTSRAARLR